MSDAVVRLDRVLGVTTDPEIAERLHRLEHEGRVERIELDHQDMARHRLRARTDRGRDCVIALPRAERLCNGAVLALDDDRAIVVRMREQRWLSLLPRDPAAAIELGYLAGNMHWRVHFDGPRLKIALEGPEEGYLARLAPLLDDQRVARASDD